MGSGGSNNDREGRKSTEEEIWIYTTSVKEIYEQFVNRIHCGRDGSLTIRKYEWRQLRGRI